MANEYIPLESSIAEFDSKIDELRRVAVSQSINLDREIRVLQKKADRARKDLFSALNPFQKSQVARHPKRPNFNELVSTISDDFLELHGDRNFQDDRAVCGGIAKIGSISAIMIGHMKGRSTKENIVHNFGMPRPEGYRKALRLMSLAERFSLPIITFIDTPGAYPGIGAEERGQSESIAKNIMVMAKLKVPIVSVVTGEGGSGGALALAVANRVHMLEHSVYSVISPEGCASILFKDASESARAAEALQLTASKALENGVIDSVILEPIGGAHRSVELTASKIKETLLKDLSELGAMSGDELRSQRMNKFLSMGNRFIKN